MLRPAWVVAICLCVATYVMRIYFNEVTPTAIATDGTTVTCGLGATPLGVAAYTPNCAAALQGVQNTMNLLNILAVLFGVAAAALFCADLASRHRERTQQRPGFPARP